jgi:hypothetical protein
MAPPPLSPRTRVDGYNGDRAASLTLASRDYQNDAHIAEAAAPGANSCFQRPQERHLRRRRGRNRSQGREFTGVLERRKLDGVEEAT